MTMYINLKFKFSNKISVLIIYNRDFKLKCYIRVSNKHNIRYMLFVSLFMCIHLKCLYNSLCNVPTVLYIPIPIPTKHNYLGVYT